MGPNKLNCQLKVGGVFWFSFAGISNCCGVVSFAVFALLSRVAEATRAVDGDRDHVCAVC